MSGDHMPKLHSRYGYPVVLVAMSGCGLGPQRLDDTAIGDRGAVA